MLSICSAPLLLTILLFGSLCIGFKPIGLPIPKAASSPQAVQEVDFCTLAANPEAYAGKLVKVKAIVGMVIGPTSDGDNILYSPDCEGKRDRMLIEEELSEKALARVGRFIKGPNPNQKVGRAEVVLVGRIHGPGRFGYLVDYEFAFEVIKIEKIGKVSPRTPWPKK